MKITIYELLGMVKDGKQPKGIKYNGYLLSWDNVDKDYYCEEYDNLFTYLFTNEQTTLVLEEKVEILELEEEKKTPEKFKINYEIDEENTINMKKATMLECDLACRINEIIDYLDYFKSKGE